VSSLLEFYSGNGIYIAWDWSGTAGVNLMKISRSDYGRGGPFEIVDTVEFPEYEYIDQKGNIDSFYLLEEVNSSDESTILFSHPIKWGEETLLNASIMYEILALQRLRIWRERLFFNRLRTAARAEFIDWNFNPEPVIEINAKEDEQNQGKQQLSMVSTITETTEALMLDYPNGLKYTIDYSGNVFFWDDSGNPQSIRSYDDVWATYQFKAFSNHEINSALYQALRIITAQPGVCKITTIADAPFNWDRAIIAGAVGILLRRLYLRFLNPTEAIPFLLDGRSPELASSGRAELMEKISSQSKEYMEEFKEQKELLRIQGYPGIHVITTPEFILPGGRSRVFRAMFKTS
jgi:hypothetical protein